ncbi:hypothetical protein [Streptomyces phaeochromogenes]|uniref:hypothetical protein n=1 Tax=Streptomyces phaeochromogenes TaxID=1923 RepID=UPI002E13A7A3|nr:hypothetical protein [Streptomyces phaeochromogenes]WSJ08690.1 hypothetical protein OG437_36240 [Streptomyces phaeochromogenes]
MAVQVFMVLMGCALAVLFGVLTGAGAGYLARRDGASYPAAVGKAAAAFAATLMVATAVTAALCGLAG